MALALAACGAPSGTGPSTADLSLPSADASQPNDAALPMLDATPAPDLVPTPDLAVPMALGAPTITTPFDDGAMFFRAAAAGSVTVTATVKPGSAGLDESTIALQYQVAGQAAQTLTGVKGATDADGTEHWTFQAPRAAGLAGAACGAAACDGATPLALTLVASDTLGRTSSSSHTSLFLDGAAPALAIAPDTTWHAASALLAVPATMTDSGVGVDLASVALTDGTGTTYPTGAACAASPCTINVPASDFTVAAGRREGTLALTLSVKDKFANAGTATGSRLVDGEAPVVTIGKLYPRGGSAGSGAVTYPAAVAGSGYATGYDGAHYLLGDSVHVQATIVDGDSTTTGSGVNVSSLQARVDGLSGGSAVTGTPVALSASPPYNLGLNGCTSGTKSCTIDFDLPLSAPFDAGTAIDGSVGVVLIASDVVGNQATSSASGVKLTRFWWSRTLGTSGAAVTSLAVHPNGDLLATTATTANNDGVFALYADGPLNGGTSSNCAGGAVPGVNWCVGHDFYAAGSGLGAINGVAVGDDSNGKLAYVTTSAGDVVALTGAGAKQWSCGKLFGTGLSAPAVATSRVATQASCEAVLFGNGNKALAATCNPTGAACVQATGSSADPLTTPIATVNATYYVGTNNRVGQATIDGTSGQLTTLNYFGSNLGSIDGLAFDGAELYASSNQGAALYQLSTALVRGFTAAFGAKPPAGSPVVRGTSVLSSDSAGALRTTSVTASGSVVPATLIALTQPGFTPLLGSDGRTYVGSTNGVVTAVQDSPPAIAWTFSGVTTSSFSVAPTMDCGGHLYAAAADTVFAFVTDARGLRSTVWPKYQRDSRNSGNADRTAASGAPYGVYNGTVCVQ